ncbi:MAG: DUF3368 domain-containing protein [Prolixibacteraceae bacterium]|nr:DUF3368 domain-containing protein [Prolixibacteraceae bacterium]
MKNGVVIADSGPIISLALIDKLHILDSIFDEVKIANAVWKELTRDESKSFIDRIKLYFKDKIFKIIGFNELTFIMDYGESESLILYNEIEADFLLIDDKKARNIAENFGMKCIGTLGLLSIAKDKNLVSDLRPIFIEFLKNKRFYTLKIMNLILQQQDEEAITTLPAISNPNGDRNT